MNEKILNKTESNKFVFSVRQANHLGDVEKAIEAAVNDLLKTFFYKAVGSANVKHTYVVNGIQTDGLLTIDDGINGSYSIMVEAKKDLILSGSKGKKDRSKILCQVIYYFKKLQEKGVLLPSAVVCADRDEIFVVPSNFILKYLEKDYDWNIAPSSAAALNLDLYQELIEDTNLNFWVESILKDSFSVDQFCRRVSSIARKQENTIKIKIDIHTLEKAFEDFQRTVFAGETSNSTNKVEFAGQKKPLTYIQVQIFVKALLGDANIYPHNHEKNTIVIEYMDHKGEVRIQKFPPNSRFTFDAEAYESFFQKYDRIGLTLIDRKKITEIADTLFEEFDRRFTGDYWTPEVWVKEAHKMIEKELGEKWEEKYVVWDPACGSKNLTRDLRFKELYCSTLHQEELNLSEDYNKEATSFQFDFLNDNVDLHSEILTFDGEENRKNRFKLPDGLINALKTNKPIIFFANPPYGQSSNSMEAGKIGISDTEISTKMKKIGYNFASMELYTQFIYRVQLFAKTFGYTKDFHFFFFNKGFLTSPSFSKFTKQLCKQFQFEDGFMLNAGEFKGTSSAWGIIFSHWSLKNNDLIQESFPFSVKKSEVVEGRSQIFDFAKWIGKISPTSLISDLNIKSLSQGIKRGEFPTTANGFGLSKGGNCGTYSLDSFGYLLNKANSVQESDKGTALFSFCYNNGHGFPVNKINFEKISTIFSIRKSVLPKIAEADLLWVRDKDVFPAPTEKFQSSAEWKSFSDDCVIYSLFSGSQTSLRDYEYGNKKWRINNQFFWKSREDIRKLAQKNGFLEIEIDLETDSERFAFNWIENNKEFLSIDAANLLEISNKIHEYSFKWRKLYNYEHPKYNLMTWDSGWVQIYKMCYPNGRDSLGAAKLDETNKKLWEEFKKAQRALGDKIAKQYSEDTGF